MIQVISYLEIVLVIQRFWIDYQLSVTLYTVHSKQIFHFNIWALALLFGIYLRINFCIIQFQIIHTISKYLLIALSILNSILIIDLQFECLFFFWF